jgi:Xaa-Pro aminopeptidase
MMNLQVFDLQKIKELSKPVETLQGNLSSIRNIYKKFDKIQLEFINTTEKKQYINSIQIIVDLLEEIYNHLEAISNANINTFLNFHDYLIKNYKESFRNFLKSLGLNQSKIKNLGLFLIENKKISKIIEKPSYVYSVDEIQWLDILDSLKFNTLFKETIKKCDQYYQKLVEERLQSELKSIPKDTDPTLISDFKDFFRNNPNMTFSDFLNEIEQQLTQNELDKKRDIIEKAKEKKKMEELKKTQKAQQQSYQDYLRLSDKEFERMRRKKKREKLSELIEKPKNKKELEISQEITEKIEKFKSKFDNTFEEKYMIQKDESENPLDVIRERKKKKENEFKDFMKKFENT